MSGRTKRSQNEGGGATATVDHSTPAAPATLLPIVLATALISMLGCASAASPNSAGSTSEPMASASVNTAPVKDTVVRRVTDPKLSEQIARLQLQLLEKDAQVLDLKGKLDEAIREVVRTMAKLQSSATRAEAASAMVEGEIALQQLQSVPVNAETARIGQTEQLLRMSTTEFDRENYGGALYLASQARSIARAGEGQSSGSDRASLQAGESRFVIPLSLEVTKRSNVRKGPGIGFPVVVTLDPGAPLVGHSFKGEWIRVSSADQQSGWIFHNLVETSRSRNP